MDDSSYINELECLKASYDSSEFEYIISSNSPILKFNLQKNVSITFEILPTYPNHPPLISISSAELTKSERCAFESKIKELAHENLGFPMIMDLVIKLQQMVVDYETCHPVVEKEIHQNCDPYIAIILIDHMRQRKKYSGTLASWASELNMNGCLLFYQRWIFLLLEGSKKFVKEFIIRHRTVCIDIDSTGKPCKEKMSKNLFEGASSTHLSTFSVKDITSAAELESCFTESDLTRIFKEVIKPVMIKNKS